MSIVKDLHDNVIAPYDLPPPNTRWTPNRKLIVVRAIESGMLQIKDAAERYHLGEVELVLWGENWKRYGIKGLQVTKSQSRRREEKVKSGR